MSYSCADFAQDVFNECEHLGIVDLSTVTASDDALLQEQAELTLKAIRDAVQAMRKMHGALRNISDRGPEEAPEEEDYDDTESAYNNGMDVGSYELAAIARDALAQIEGEEATDTAEVEPEPVGRRVWEYSDPAHPDADNPDGGTRWVAAWNETSADAAAEAHGWVKSGGECFTTEDLSKHVPQDLYEMGVDVVL